MSTTSLSTTTSSPPTTPPPAHSSHGKSKPLFTSQKTHFSKNSKFRFRHIPTVRSLALIAFTCILITGPVPRESDLFAAVIGYSILILLVTTISLTFFLGWWYLKNTSFGITHDLSTFQDQKAHSNTAIKTYLIPREVNIFPFFSLHIKPVFFHTTQTHTWKLTGKISDQNTIAQNIIFPHRGNWIISHLSLKLCDTFGLSEFQWNHYLKNREHSFKIHPPKQLSQNLPAFTSDTQSGGELTELHKSKGEYYDIKRYHPSDGSRKILWKVFAKSGELLSRHPEPSMTPEGTVALYTCAAKHDDQLVGLTLAHLQDLESNSYEYLVTGDGFLEKCASSLSEAEDKFVLSSWDCAALTLEDRITEFNALAKEVSKKNMKSISSCTLFISEKTLSSSEELEKTLQFGDYISSQSVRCLWILQKSTTKSKSHYNTKNDKRSQKNLLNFLLYSNLEQTQNIEEENRNTLNETSTQKFIDACQLRNWKFQIV